MAETKNPREHERREHDGRATTESRTRVDERPEPAMPEPVRPEKGEPWTGPAPEEDQLEALNRGRAPETRLSEDEGREALAMGTPAPSGLAGERVEAGSGPRQAGPAHGGTASERARRVHAEAMALAETRQRESGVPLDRLGEVDVTTGKPAGEEAGDSGREARRFFADRDPGQPVDPRVRALRDAEHRALAMVHRTNEHMEAVLAALRLHWKQSPHLPLAQVMESIAQASHTSTHGLTDEALLHTSARFLESGQRVPDRS